MPSICSRALRDFSISWFRTERCINWAKKIRMFYSPAASLRVCLPWADNLCFMVDTQKKKKKSNLSNLKHLHLIFELFFISWTFIWNFLLNVFVLNISHLPGWLCGSRSLLNICHSWILKFWSNALYFIVIWLMCFKFSFSWSFSMQGCQSRHSIFDWCFLEYWWW